MADQRTRELQRKWQETGAAEDEAVFLLERVRAGTLDRVRLELAACCGHSAAQFAIGRPSSALNMDDLAGFATQLSAVEAVRLAAALARQFLPLFEEALPEDDGPRRSLDAAETWCVSPNSISVESLREAAWGAGDSSDEVVLDRDPPLHDIAELAQRVSEMAQCAATDYPEGVAAGLIDALRHAAHAAEAEVARRLDDAIAPEFVSWALGSGDPVAERVEASGIQRATSEPPVPQRKEAGEAPDTPPRPA